MGRATPGAHDGGQGIDGAIDLVDRVVEIEAQTTARADSKRLVRERRAVAAGAGFDTGVVQGSRQLDRVMALHVEGDQ